MSMIAISHIAIGVRDMEISLGFYRDVLGFGVSDYIVTPFRAYFLHVNPRHHSVAAPSRPSVARELFDTS